jgi:hypothetical protein
MARIRSPTSARRTRRGHECSPSAIEESSGRYHRAMDMKPAPRPCE